MEPEWTPGQSADAGHKELPWESEFHVADITPRTSCSILVFSSVKWAVE